MAQDVILGTDTVKDALKVKINNDMTELFAAIPGAATATSAGVVELATDAETLTGIDTTRACTPANIAAKMATFVPAGTIMLFGQNSAPTGWTKKTDWTDQSMLIYTTGNIVQGGTVDAKATHTHIGPSHTHTGPSHAHAKGTFAGPSHTHSPGTLKFKTGEKDANGDLSMYLTNGAGAVVHNFTGTDVMVAPPDILVFYRKPGVQQYYTKDGSGVTAAGGTGAITGTSAAGGTAATGAGGTAATGANSTPKYCSIIAAQKN